MTIYLIRANHRGCEDGFIIERENQYDALKVVLAKMELLHKNLISIRINEISREAALSGQYRELYAHVKREDEKEEETVSEQETKSYQLTDEHRKLIVMLLDKYVKNTDTSGIRDAIGDDEVNRLTKNARLAKLALRQE